MILYHGTNCDILKPDPRKGHRGTDFGQGFYLTPDMESARNMASLVVAREGTGCRTINVFEFDEVAARLAGLMTPAMMLSIMKDRPWRVVQYSFHTLRSVRFLKLKEVWHEQ